MAFQFPWESGADLCVLRGDASGEAEIETQYKCQRALVPRCPAWQLPRGKDAQEPMSLSLYSQSGDLIGVFVLRGVLGPHPLLSPQRPMAQTNPQSFPLKLLKLSNIAKRENLLTVRILLANLGGFMILGGNQSEL